MNELIAAEEAKRERRLDPAERWRLIQSAIAWAESQQTVRRSTKESCLANQARLLARLRVAGELK